MTVGNLSRATVRTIVAASVLLAPAVPAAQSQRRPVAQAATPQAQAAPETIKLTIDDAVRRAIEQNPDLAVVKLGTDVEAEHVSARHELDGTERGRGIDRLTVDRHLDVLARTAVLEKEHDAGKGRLELREPCATIGSNGERALVDCATLERAVSLG